ncbi:preprotein translocase subunit SecG [Desulfobotulus sp.]|jgi:preprotein translocase subunit SecG|uniref:preprotein translocase subunit SecG n=1 Tax=Desulfobotulus sp. TaxID=1940337 RepID=UPI002A367392|nr:preprotein translocase subunit SecG [Desulfobotulus sp.]MDY0163897.1 preprotein translocase subunit SecG [Desulfobotulus sp.]
MTALLVTLHIVVCLTLIVIVLLQAGKGAEMGAAFGSGSSQALLGASGGQTLIGKITTGVAILFMLTSLSLAWISGNKKVGSIMPESVIVQPVVQEKASE